MNRFRKDRSSSQGGGIRIALRPTIGTNGRVPKAAQPWHRAQELTYDGWKKRTASVL